MAKLTTLRNIKYTIPYLPTDVQGAVRELIDDAILQQIEINDWIIVKKLNRIEVYRLTAWAFVE